MIVKTLDQILGTEDDVHAETWNSRRLLLRRDGVGFSMHDTIMKAGTKTFMWYANHIEAVYCVEGEGEIEDHATGRKHAVRPGTLYCLDKHDKHTVSPRTDLRMICVFNPAVTGHEVHDERGVYPLITDDEPAPKAAAG
ncbi:MAG: ectoine synthase [Rhodospirillales bacterium]|nr:ectoine synthase [Rhodospirillales bacterium]